MLKHKLLMPDGILILEPSGVLESTDFEAAIHDIAWIAMVGETKWQHGVATFCKPFTKASIQYFDHAQSTEAREWLDKA